MRSPCVKLFGRGPRFRVPGIQPRAVLPVIRQAHTLANCQLGLRLKRHLERSAPTPKGNAHHDCGSNLAPGSRGRLKR